MERILFPTSIALYVNWLDIIRIDTNKVYIKAKKFINHNKAFWFVYIYRTKQCTSQTVIES